MALLEVKDLDVRFAVRGGDLTALRGISFTLDKGERLGLVGESGAGMVKVTMNGRHDVKRVEIDPELMKGDKEMIEDLLAAAVNDANRRVESMTQEKMSGVTAGMGLPPGMKLPF